MLALAEACATGRLEAQIGLVISNRPDAQGIEAAAKLGLGTAVIDHTLFDSRRAFEEALNDKLTAIQPQWIVLAGFMRILTPEFVNQWQGRILNIHPSLLLQVLEQKQLKCLYLLLDLHLLMLIQWQWKQEQVSQLALELFTEVLFKEVVELSQQEF